MCLTIEKRHAKALAGLRKRKGESVITAWKDLRYEATAYAEPRLLAPVTWHRYGPGWNRPEKGRSKIHPRNLKVGGWITTGVLHLYAAKPRRDISLTRQRIAPVAVQIKDIVAVGVTGDGRLCFGVRKCYLAPADYERACK